MQKNKEAGSLLHQWLTTYNAHVFFSLDPKQSENVTEMGGGAEI